MSKKYIGGEVQADFDPDTLTLKLTIENERGIAEEMIIIEPEVWDNLRDYMDREIRKLTERKSD